MTDLNRTLARLELPQMCWVVQVLGTATEIMGITPEGWTVIRRMEGGG